MPDLAPFFDMIARAVPFECMQMAFMQKALLGLLLLAPMSAAMGIQVVNFRMAFFADAISHSALAGVAIGLILGIDPKWTMPVFGLIVGLGIIWSQRRSSLASDTVIGVFLSAVIAFGIAVVSRNKNVARNVQQFLYGDILTISESEIWLLIALFIVLLAFQAYGYNNMLSLGLNPVLAKTHGVRVGRYQYCYAALLSLIVIFSVWMVGILLVTAMLIVPAAAARNFARSAGSMIWWAVIVSATSSVAGLLISAQDWARTATGATVVLISFVWFIVSFFVVRLARFK